MIINIKNCRLRDFDRFGVDIRDFYLAMILDSLETLIDKKTSKSVLQREIDWLFHDQSGQISLKQACENTSININLVRKIALEVLSI